MHRSTLLLFLVALALPARAQAPATTLSGGTLVVTGGAVLDLHGGTLGLDPGGTLDEDGGLVTGGLLSATRTLNAPEGVDVGGLGAVLTSAQELGETTVTRGHASHTRDSHTSISRYYAITAANNAGLGATLVFRYDPSELSGFAEADLVLFHSADGGTTWREDGGTVDAAAHTITLAGIDHFSRWTAASRAAPLPVELTTFEALAGGPEVVLRWATASEANNAGFEVEAQGAAPEASWARVAFVAGHGTTAAPQAYRYRVAGLAPGTYRFRLKQVDFDGTFAYSPEVEAVAGVPGAFLLSDVYPNPFNPQAAFTLAVGEAQHVTVALHDLLGRRMALLHDGRLAANETYRFTLDGAALASGSYLVRVAGERFTAVRAVTLMK